MPGERIIKMKLTNNTLSHGVDNEIKLYQVLWRIVV
jgi:hypothetical protein